MARKIMVERSTVKRYARVFFCVLALPLLTAMQYPAEEFIRVSRVINGHTIELENGERVNLLGVNTPKTKRHKKPVDAFAKEAAEFTKRMVEDKLVRLELDPLISKRDKDSRTLAYVFLQDGTLLNAEIIRHGYGFAASNKPPLKYEYAFLRLELEAREKKRGIWASAPKAER